MNRRRFVRAAASIAATAGVAGCAGGPPGPAGTDGADGAGGNADVSTTVVQNVPDGDGADPRADRDVTETGAGNVLLESIVFQRAGEKGLVVAGELVNRSDRAFEEVAVEVTLFDANEVEDDLLDSASADYRDGRLAPGNTWQWAVTIPDDPAFRIDYFAVTARAQYA